MNIEAGGSASATKAILGQEMPQLPQGTTALGGRNFLRRQTVGLSKCGINLFRQGTEESLGIWL